MAPDSARSMTASWSQRQKSSGPWAAFTWAGQGTYLMHYNLDARPNPPLWAKVSEKRGFQLSEDCGALFLGANYPEMCHLNRMRPYAYWQNKGLEWLWWYPTLTVWFESCSRTCSWTKCAKNVCWSRQSAHSGVRGRHIFLRPTHWRAVRCREAASRTRLLLPRAIPGSACQLGFPILRQFHFREQTWVADFTYGYRVVQEFLFKSWDFWEPTKIGVL